MGIVFAKVNYAVEKMYMIDEQLYLKCVEMKYYLSHFSEYTIELREFIDNATEGKMSQYKRLF